MTQPRMARRAPEAAHSGTRRSTSPLPVLTTRTSWMSGRSSCPWRRPSLRTKTSTSKMSPMTPTPLTHSSNRGRRSGSETAKRTRKGHASARGSARTRRITIVSSRAACPLVYSRPRALVTSPSRLYKIPRLPWHNLPQQPWRAALTVRPRSRNLLCSNLPFTLYSTSRSSSYS